LGKTYKSPLEGGGGLGIGRERGIKIKGFVLKSKRIERTQPFWDFWGVGSELILDPSGGEEEIGKDGRPIKGGERRGTRIA